MYTSQDLRLTQALRSETLDQIWGTLECTICLDVMHVPFLAQCGHSFCYGCLKLWFDTKLNCPTCRKDMEYPPILNIQLKEVSNAMTNLIRQNGPAYEADQLQSQREANEHEYELDFRRRKLFGDKFDLALTLIDKSDGVARCGNCHWEAHGLVCLHCGARFRVARDDSYYDSEDGEAYNEDEDEEREGPNEYDTEDSFIDEREAGDLSQDEGSNILSSLDGESWRGFDERDYGNELDAQRQLELLLDEHERDLQMMEHVEVALDSGDEVVFGGIVDSDDGGDSDGGRRRPRVISISSDEE